MDSRDKNTLSSSRTRLGDALLSEKEVFVASLASRKS